jgi:branched-chain amino acid aminotransferase
MSGAPKSEKIWLDGSLVEWEKAQVHVMTHTLHYGMGVFEGIRCYKAEKGPAVFRLAEHTKRLFNSAKIVGIDIPFTQQRINAAILDTIAANRLDECYIRPIAFLGDNVRGLNTTGAGVRVAVAVWTWGAYLGEEALANGINVKVSSFTRHHENVFMTKAKVCGAYVNSIMAKLEAKKGGYDEALLLDPSGHVAEGSGENIFIARNGRLKTPPLTSVLEGITRGSVISIAHDMGIEVVEQYFSRDEAYIADEAFFTGTAAELTPIRSLDDRIIGEGGMGPITRKLQTAYFAAIRGREPRYEKWLTYVK